MRKNIGLIFIAACLIAACSTVQKTTEKQKAAMNKLAAENIPFSTRAFMSAAEKGDMRILKLFLEAGMDVNLSDNGTPLTAAVYGNSLDAVRLLVNNGANVNEAAYWGTPLGIAAYKGYYEVAKFLIEKGADVNRVSRNDMSPLFNAVLIKGKAKIVDLLLEYGADPNFKQEVTKETPLIIAAGKGNLHIVKSLIKGGADVNYKESGGLSALDWALMGSHIDVAEALLNCGSLKIESFDIPMIVALEKKEFKFIELLVKHGLDVNGNFGGMPYVVWCAKQKFNKSVKFLIDHGADIKATDKAGYTALTYALEDKNQELIQIIKSHIDSIKIKKAKQNPATIRPRKAS